MLCNTCKGSTEPRIVIMEDGRVCCYTCGRLEAEQRLRKARPFTRDGGYLGEGNYRLATLARMELRKRARVTTSRMQAFRETRLQREATC